MFGIGPMEMLVILLVILIVFGPKRLPEVMKTVGRMMAELKKTADEVKKEIIQQEDIQEIQESLREISDVPRLVQRQLEKEVEALAQEEEAKKSGGEQENKEQSGNGTEGKQP